jgi:hypothetical protein
MINRRTFLSGPAGTGKTTQAVEHLRELLQSGLQAEGILVIAPQRSLLKPYQDLLRQADADFPGGDELELLTVGGLAKRSVDLWWPALAREAGFAKPDRPPTYLTLETAQYYMERVVQPFLTERYYFEEVRLSHERIYSQLLDNLNKAALIGFPYTDVGKRLIGAWTVLATDHHLCASARLSQSLSCLLPGAQPAGLFTANRIVSRLAATRLVSRQTLRAISPPDCR